MLWRLLSVGSIIRVTNKQEVPADVIILQVRGGAGGRLPRLAL